MAPAQSSSRSSTPTRGQGSGLRASGGTITGHLLKITRERIPSTQRQLAERLNMDVTTVQSWETGRRPLTAVSLAQFQTVCRHLLGLNADPELVALLDVASHADAVIACALGNASPRHHDLQGHPLGQWVFTRAATHMIVWALTGTSPAAIPPPPASIPRRRGPSPSSPLLAETERRRLFTHLRRCAEIADRAGDGGTLLRRQAVYLASYDNAPDTHAWLAHMQRPVTFTTTSTSAWSEARSVATSLTRYGEYDRLWAFIEHGMGDDFGELANLNYWAYWLGMDSVPRADDGFMAVRSAHRWDAGALLRALTGRLDRDLGCLDLNVHSVWALLTWRPGLAAADSSLSVNLAGRVSELLDTGTVSPRARRELEQVHYGLRLNGM
ncbi:helix-turn-helix domain-containing protein [Streptomyces radicis]|nr:helix-turn-helix domain-containing protein [Streptomyces radicis]RKN15867.1 XRE family transcriptional regulator [Streptomyces radicis]